MAQLVEVSAGGIRWQVTPEHRDRLLGPEGLRLDEWLRSGEAQVVKHGPHRTVYRVRLSGLDFHLKHYRTVGVRGWLRQLVRPAKARREYQRTLAVAARRVPTFVPLGVGEGRAGPVPGDSFLLTLSLEDTESLRAFLETTFHSLDRGRQTRVRQRLAAALGELVARMHDAGIVHNDLHAGNLLVRLGADDQVFLYLIDLHAVRLGRPLVWPCSRANLVMLNRWFVLKASRADRQRFWHAYVRARRGCPVSVKHGRDLERRTWASNRAFWRNRDRRCLASNRYYRRLRRAGKTDTTIGHAVRDLDGEALNWLLDDPDEPFRRPGVKLLKDGPSSTVAELEFPVGGVPRQVIYKRFRVTALSDPWTALVRRSGALRSWVMGHGLRERGLPTPRPLAAFHRRRIGLCHEGYVLTEKVSDAVDLHGFLAGLDRLNAAGRRTALRVRVEQLARLVRDLHRHQLSQRDLKANNVLLTGAADAAAESGCWLIDLVGVRRHRRLGRRRRVQNVARLNASFYRNAAVTRTDRLRFLRVYLQWGWSGTSGWKRWWQDIERATRAKAAHNARNGRPLG
ncbi:MAG TPA: lipopolysaccharide kinase InaA family protein [Gemmataceae bacterium]|nr:lipopolysaccharide kinase InaA family protein [Gemmataceae bacterium]